MSETSLTTDGFLETTSIDPLNKDSHIEKGDLNMEEEAALLSRNPGEDEEQENEIPCTQANQERAKNTNNQTIEKRKVKQAVDVCQAISSTNNQRNEKRPREEHEKSNKTAASSSTKKARQDDEQSSAIQEKINSSKQSIAKL